MKTAMKKLLSFVLVAMMLVSAIPFQASATETEEVAPIKVIFKVDGVEQNTVEKTPADGAGATVENLIKYCFDKNWEASYEFDKAWNSTTQSNVGLQASVYAGEKIYIALTTKVVETTAPATEPKETTAPTTEPTEPKETTPPTTEATEPKETTPATEPKDDKDVVVGDNYITLVLDLNYEGSVDKYVKAVDPDDRMGVIMENVPDPTRENYVFAGWYWDDDYDYKVKDSEYIGGKAGDYIRIYAKWTRKSSANNVLLSIYVNGKTSSAAKIVDISGYGEADGMIDISEVRTVVQKYFTAKDSEGINYDGLFTYDTWNRGAYDDSDEANYVTVNANDDTYVYVMIYNAKTGSSSSSNSGTSSSNSGTADSTNPKTGDQIFMAVTVMAVSASALALVYFFNKKRATK